jgi:LacI family transcriptional regulator
MLSIRNIAAATGYGVATVSMSLRNDPRIPEKTRLLIQETARQLGYAPDTRISKLMSEVKNKRIHRINQPLAYVLFWESAKDCYQFQNYRLFRAGAQKRAQEFGYTFEDFVINTAELSPQRFNAIMRTRAIPGALIAPVSHAGLNISSHGRETNLTISDYSAATIAYSLAQPILHRATHDHALAAELTVEKCQERGYRRIGFLCAEFMHLRVNGRWLSGFLQAQHRLSVGQKIPPLLIENTANDELFDRWFDHHRPDVIITDQGNLVTQHLARKKIQMPETVAIAHLDALNEGSHYSGIDQCCREIGSAAFDLLLAQIHRNERGNPNIRKTVMLEPLWHEGDSLPIKNIRQ